jgi:enamidase
MTDDDNDRVVVESEMALQLVQAGNLRSAIDVALIALEHGAARRILIASDTPTGTGVIPLAILRTMAELVALGPLTPEIALAAATGNVGEIYGLDAGIIEIGRPADLLVVDAPLGSAARSWREALRIGDLPAVAVAVTEGRVRFDRSRNTPPPARRVQVTRSPRGISEYSL